MAGRVGDQDVRDLLSAQAEALPDDFKTDRHIRKAAKLVERVEANDDNNILDDEDLFDIELTLAAGFCKIVDPLYTSRATSKGSGSFQRGQTGPGPFELNDLLISAMGQDFTGTLAKINAEAKNGRKKAELTWLGKAPSGQTDYVDRD